VKVFHRVIVAAAVVVCAVASANCSKKVGSLVHVVYPEVAGAPVINMLRVKWGMNDLAREVLRPGQEITAVLVRSRFHSRANLLYTLENPEHSAVLEEPGALWMLDASSGMLGFIVCAAGVHLLRKSTQSRRES